MDTTHSSKIASRASSEKHPPTTLEEVTLPGASASTTWAFYCWIWWAPLLCGACCEEHFPLLCGEEHVVVKGELRAQGEA